MSTLLKVGLLSCQFAEPQHMCAYPPTPLIFLNSAASFKWQALAVLLLLATQKVCSFFFFNLAQTLTQKMLGGKSLNLLGSIPPTILLKPHPQELVLLGGCPNMDVLECLALGDTSSYALKQPGFWI